MSDSDYQVSGKSSENSFRFEVEIFDRSGSEARVGKIHTPHGSTDTPVFMPVATHAVVKTLSPAQLKEAGTTIILSNTYHLAVRPGEKLVEKMGKLHKFMRWDGPILTDSGGFQMFSLADLRKFSEDGVTFRSHINGDLFVFTPERVVEIQQTIGSDIMMPLDHCVGWPCSYEEAQAAVERTYRWAKRCQAAQTSTTQVLFGIVQGSAFADLRRVSAEQLISLNFPGYAIGGLAVGESKEAMSGMIHEVNKILPLEKPRYLMGVGKPEDILMAVEAGVDMFDCVMPTRNARGGGAFTLDGKLQIRNSCHRESEEPVERECPCYCCRTFTRAYLHHLFSSKIEDILGPVLLTMHNLTFYHRLVAMARQAIREGRFCIFAKEFLTRYNQSRAETDSQ